MKFRGFLKKGLKKQFDNATLSDPGSDDSWNLLYQDQGDSLTNVPAEAPNTNEAGPASVAASSTTTPCVIAETQKDSIQENATKDNSAVPQTIISNTIAEQKENVASKQHKKLLPFTSTPFVRNKRNPAFDLSSIISPIEISSIEGIPEEVLPNDSGPALMVNRKNPVKTSDDMFTQLLAPSNKPKNPKKPTTEGLFGVTPLQAVRNLGDTTRQYAGGAVKRRGTVTVSQNDTESSWETSEVITCSTTVSSPSKTVKRNRESYEAKRTLATKANLASETRISTGAGAKLSGKSTSKEISSPKQSSHHHFVSRKSVEAESLPKSGMTSGADGKTSEHQVRDRRTLTPNGIARQESNTAQEKRPISIYKTPKSEKKANMSVRFVDDVSVEPAVKSSAVTDARCSNVQPDTVKENPSQEHNGPLISSKSEIVEELRVKRSKDKSQEHQDTARSDKKTVGKEMEKKTKTLKTVQTLYESQDKDRDALSLQKQIPTPGDNLEIFNNEVAECIPPKQTLKKVHMNAVETGNAVGILCHQSEFCVQIGSNTLTQTSSFGFVLSQEQNKVHTKDNVGTRSDTNHACPAVQDQSHLIKSIQPGYSKEVESSSEEERILLRAQSLKLKENQSHSRNSKITKILDNGHFRLNQQSPSRNNGSDQRAEIAKSPIKLFSDGTLPGIYEKNQETEPAAPSPAELDKDDCQSAPPQIPSKSGLHDVTGSSPDLALMSRNPTDYPKSCDEDDLQLEIMSSSEEDVRTSQKLSSQSKNIQKTVIQTYNVTNETLQTHVKHPRRGQSLSFRAKQIRRRREENLRSQRESSESESQSHCPPERGRSPEVPESPGFSDKNLDIQSRENREKSKERPVTSKKGLDAPKKSEKNMKIRKRSQKQRANDAKADVVQVPQDNIPEPIFPEELTPAEPDLPQGVEEDLQKQNVETVPLMKNGNRAKKTKTLGKKNPTVALKESAEGNDVIVPSSTSSNIEEGSRYSKRNRRPPPMYWLGSRARTSDLEEIKESSDPDPASHNQNDQSARRKRKIEKASQSGKIKTLKRVKQTKPTPMASQNHDPQSCSDDEVFIYDAENAMTLGGQDLPCEKHEVKITEFVSGCGMKGSMLLLGVGAKYHEQKSSLFNQVFYVLDGEISYHFVQEERTLKTGSVFIVPKGEKYYINNLGKTMGKLFVTKSVV